MDLPGLEKIESQIQELLERYKSVKASREELALRVNELESEISELQKENEQLQVSLEEARRNTRDFDKEERIKARVDELLAKLEGF